MSPNTLYAHLCVIAMGLQGMQIEENAKRLLANLNGVQKNLETFAEVFEKLGTHLKNAQQSYGEADRRFEKRRVLWRMCLAEGLRHRVGGGADSVDPDSPGSGQVTEHRRQTC